MEEQTTTATETSTPATITGIAFGSAYVDDFATCYRFYSDVLGLRKQYDMGENACFFSLGDTTGFYLEGGNAPADVTTKSVRGSVTFNVGSAHAMFARLREAGTRMVQEEPMDMGQGNFWFQFHDPAGNIMEILGGE